jgi:hypothetical protein
VRAGQQTAAAVGIRTSGRESGGKAVGVVITLGNSRVALNISNRGRSLNDNYAFKRRKLDVQWTFSGNEAGLKRKAKDRR